MDMVCSLTMSHNIRQRHPGEQRTSCTAAQIHETSMAPSETFYRVGKACDTCNLACKNHTVGSELTLHPRLPCSA